jgi:hypothetical protein
MLAMKIQKKHMYSKMARRYILVTKFMVYRLVRGREYLCRNATLTHYLTYHPGTYLSIQFLVLHWRADCRVGV